MNFFKSIVSFTILLLMAVLAKKVSAHWWAGEEGYTIPDRWRRWSSMPMAPVWKPLKPDKKSPFRWRDRTAAMIGGQDPVILDS